MYQYHDVAPLSLKSRRAKYEESQRSGKDEKGQRDRKDEKDDRGRKNHQRNKINLVVKRTVILRQVFIIIKFTGISNNY